MTSKTSHGEILAIIAARKGSIGLPGKNLRELAGKPLIAHTIVAARDCPLVGRVVVSSDDQRIGDVSKAWGADFIRRPDELATATAHPEDAVRHVLETLDAEGSAVRTIAFMQPTTPLIPRSTDNDP